MKNKTIFGLFFLILIFSLAFSNCSSHGTSDVTIHINLGLNNASAANTFENSIFDRIFRLFSKDAEAAPSNVTSIILNISGSGMDTISNTYPSSTTSIDLEVPSGPSRLFEVLAQTPSATLRGAVTQSLVGGTTVTIPIQMGLYETKIVIPDWFNSRLVQIDVDFSPLSWIQKTAANLTNPSNITYCRPYDIDFDSIGQIYVTNPGGSAGAPKLFLLNHINAASNTWGLILNDTRPDVYAIAIDRNLDYIYCASNTNLYRCLLGGSGFTDITSRLITAGISSFSNIRGLAVDNSGILYIAANFTISGVPYRGVIKHDPNTPTPTIITNTAFSSTEFPLDVVVKGNYIYLASYEASVYANDKITQFNDQLVLQNVLTNNPASTDHFYGPHRFLAILNRKFFIIDDGRNITGSPSFNMDRIVSFDDISGSNWNTYGSSGNSTGQFNFYEFYIC